jgi:outer membrane protein TolC
MKRKIILLVIFSVIFANLPYYALGQDDAVMQDKGATRELSTKFVAMGPSKYDRMPQPSEIKKELTFSDCYQLALAQSEKIAIDADQIKIAEAHFLTALGTITPHVSFLSQDYQEKKLSGGSNNLALNIPKSSQRQFNLTQTLFDGFKTIAAVKQSRYEKTQFINEKTRGEQLLLLDVSNAFYLLIEKREDIRALKKTSFALDERVKELITRERLGKSRPSEIVYAKAQLYSVEASIEDAQNQEVVVRQLLEFLIGWPVGELSDTYDFPTDLKDEDYYVAKASKRPDVTATEYAWHAARENIRVVDSEFLPEAAIQANYYTQRTGFDKGIDWDVTLAVSVPIFEGTDVLGRSKEANLQADQSWQTFHLTKRRAPYNIEEAYVTLTTAMSVRNVLRKAYTTAKYNYHLQKKDYKRRLVSNLDVLAAIQTLDDSERSYIHALYEAKRQYWDLRVAVGQSGTESLSDTF